MFNFETCCKSLLLKGYWADHGVTEVFVEVGFLIDGSSYLASCPVFI
jgi:hypothetical protein